MTAGLAKLVFVLAALASFVIRFPHQRRSHGIAVRTSVADAKEGLLVTIATVGLGVLPGLYIAFGLPRFADHAFYAAAAWSGTLVFAVALFVFYAAHRALGRQFSSRLKLREDHVLVTSGVYTFVRHPMYTAFWLWGIAQALLLPNWIAGLAGLVGFGFMFFARVGREEQLMLDVFGDDYRRYMQRTHRIIPWVY